MREYLVQLSIKVIVEAVDEEDAADVASTTCYNGGYTSTFEWDSTIEVIEEVPVDA